MVTKEMQVLGEPTSLLLFIKNTQNNLLPTFPASLLLVLLLMYNKYNKKVLYQNFILYRGFSENFLITAILLPCFIHLNSYYSEVLSHNV